MTTEPTPAPESGPIEFYFDFSSPYSYLASERIGELAARVNRAVAFHPILLGAVFRISGMRPLVDIPLKGDYSRLDIARSARFAGVPFTMPAVFPISTVQAARACLVLRETRPELLDEFIHRTFRAYFADGSDISAAAAVGEQLVRCGADADAVMQATQSAAIKDRLKADVEEAIARGVFGAPFFIVDGEPFWGFDRFPQLERWLTSGPF